MSFHFAQIGSDIVNLLSLSAALSSANARNSQFDGVLYKIAEKGFFDKLFDKGEIIGFLIKNRRTVIA